MRRSGDLKSTTLLKRSVLCALLALFFGASSIALAASSSDHQHITMISGSSLHAAELGLLNQFIQENLPQHLHLQKGEEGLLFIAEDGSITGMEIWQTSAQSIRSILHSNTRCTGAGGVLFMGSAAAFALHFSAPLPSTMRAMVVSLLAVAGGFAGALAGFPICRTISEKMLSQKELP